MAEEIFYNGEGKPFIDKEMKQPANWSWDYNNIKHVATQAEFNSQREFEDSVVAKYKKVADGKGRVPVVDGPDHDLKLSYRKEVKEREEKEQGMKDEIVKLRAELADKEVPKVEPETKETLGKGTCGNCKREFQRLDMHVCKGV